jgi:S-(hydroxymethyl)glutathione dehydrogenase / alcohol dehydrogenase
MDRDNAGNASKSSTLRYKAAVLHRAMAPLAIEQVEAAPLGPSDVLVRIGAAGLCHTDLEVIGGL